MLKKSLYGGGGVIVLLLLLFGRSTFSYVSTAFSRARDSVRSSVPVGFELDRARKEVDRITPEVRKNMHLIAQEEVKVEQLQKQISTLDEKLSQNHRDILRLKVDLESGSGNLIYGGTTYTTSEVKRDLVNRFDEYTTDQETLKNLSKLLSTRNDTLRVARDRLAEMQATQRKMQVQLDNLEARSRMVQVAQNASEFIFDESQLATARDLVNTIDSRLRADEKLLNAETRSLDRIPVDQEDEQADILDRISRHFDGVEGATVEQIAELAR